MLATSALYKSILLGRHDFETKLVIDGVGTFDESQLYSIRTNVQMFQSTPTVGNAVAAEIDVEMVNPNVTIPLMACLRPYVRARGTAAKSGAVTISDETISSNYFSVSGETLTIASGADASVSGETLIFPITTEEETVSEWIPQGVFYIDTREVTANNDGRDVLSIHGFDAMLKTEQDYASNGAVGDDYDTAYVRSIAAAIGVDVDDRTWELMQTGYIIPFPVGYSMREILGFIAASYVGCFVITDDGKLRLVSITDVPTETNFLIDSVGDILLVGGDSILI